MATLKLHYDGWLVLPAGLRRTLELESGDRLEAELVDGAIVLRPAKGNGPLPGLRRWLSRLLPSRCQPPCLRHLRLHRPLENERDDWPKVNGWSGSMNSTLG